MRRRACLRGLAALAGGAGLAAAAPGPLRAQAPAQVPEPGSAPSSTGAAAASPDQPPPEPREFRGAWVASVAHIDWPSRPGLTPEAQRAEALAIVERARTLGLNALILQVRPAGDALYPSALEPWSEYLTGQQGRAPDPPWDPLAFWIAEAHRRGLELHAWFNPYRARVISDRPASATHISKTHPELVRAYAIDTAITLDGQRAGQPLSLQVTLGKLPDDENQMPEYKDDRFELTARDLSTTRRQNSFLDSSLKGVVIEKVTSNGWAALGGLVAGDIVLKVNDTEVSSTDDLSKLLKGFRESKPRRVVFFVQRGIRTQFLEIEPRW